MCSIPNAVVPSGAVVTDYSNTAGDRCGIYGVYALDFSTTPSTMCSVPNAVVPAGFIVTSSSNSPNDRCGAYAVDILEELDPGLNIAAMLVPIIMLILN